MSNLTQFSGFREIPLTPGYDESAYCTTGYGQQAVMLYNQNSLTTGFYQWPSSEFGSSSYFSANWSSTPSSTSGWNYSGTTLTGMHGHFYCSLNPTIDTNSSNTVYLTPCIQNTGRFYGVLNSQASGVWMNKTKRDNLCIQRANNPSDYGNNLSRTQISTVGFGAYFAPITSTLAFSGYGSGVANGYNTTRSYGCIGYNELTKMWVVTGNAVTGAGHTIFVYKNINAPTLANTNDQTFWSQFNHGTKITITFTFPTLSDTHDYQHYKLVPLDNGNIAMIVKHAGTNIGYYLFTGNAGVNSTSWTFNSSPIFTINTTTSYHDSGWTTGDFLPNMMSPDGKYVFIWTQYYYYQTGICGFAIRVSDGNCLKIQWTDSSYAYSPVFIQQDTLVLGYGVNADSGRGQALFQYNLDELFAQYPTNGTDVTSATVEYNVEKTYTSTDYPMIWQQVSYLPNFIRGVF